MGPGLGKKKMLGPPPSEYRATVEEVGWSPGKITDWAAEERK